MRRVTFFSLCGAPLVRIQSLYSELDVLVIFPLSVSEGGGTACLALCSFRIVSEAPGRTLLPWKSEVTGTKQWVLFLVKFSV